MGRFLVKVDDERYLEWSSIVDAPVSMVMTRAQVADWTLARYGAEGVERLPARLERAVPISEVADWNRAGPNETHLNAEQIVNRYTERSTEHQSAEQEKKT